MSKCEIVDTRRKTHNVTLKLNVNWVSVILIQTKTEQEGQLYINLIIWVPLIGCKENVNFRDLTGRFHI